MENIVVGAIVGLAVVWIGLRVFRPRKDRACASGCAGCGEPNKPQPLVQIRR